MNLRSLFRGLRAIPAPYRLMIAFVAALIAGTGLSGGELSTVNVFNIGQTFAAYGLLTLALALLVMAGEFDLSLPAIYGLGAMIAVRTGASDPFLGLGLAVGAAIIVGLVNGCLVAAVQLDSVPVTLGTFIAVSGLISVLGDGKSVSYNNFSAGMRLDDPIAGVASLRSLVTVALFVAVGLLLRATRWGRDLKATGGDRRAAQVAGVRTQRIVIQTFVLSAAFTGLAGALLGYALFSASPAYGGFTSLIFGVTAALLGGVRLTGGEGSAGGVAAGVLSMALLQELLVVTEAESYVQDLLTGGLLVLIGVAVSPQFVRQARARGWLRARHVHPPAITASDAVARV